MGRRMTRVNEIELNDEDAETRLLGLRAAIALPLVEDGDLPLEVFVSGEWRRAMRVEIDDSLLVVIASGDSYEFALDECPPWRIDQPKRGQLGVVR